MKKELKQMKQSKTNTSGPEMKSSTHLSVMGNGAQIKKREMLDDNTSLIQYFDSKWCYAFSRYLPGPWLIELEFDKVLKIWRDESIDLPITRVSKIKFKKKH